MSRRSGPGGAGGWGRSPATLSRDNRIVETREFVLAERGPAQVIDTFDTSGPLEWSLRQGFQKVAKKKMREGLEKYVQFAFLAKELNGLENGDPQDLSKPFRVRLESREAKRGSTDDEQAVAAILTSELADRMPPLLTAEEPEKQGKEDKKAADSKHRKGDFVFVE